MRAREGHRQVRRGRVRRHALTVAGGGLLVGVGRGDGVLPAVGGELPAALRGRGSQSPEGAGRVVEQQREGPRRARVREDQVDPRPGGRAAHVKVGVLQCPGEQHMPGRGADRGRRQRRGDADSLGRGRAGGCEPDRDGAGGQVPAEQVRAVGADPQRADGVWCLPRVGRVRDRDDRGVGADPMTGLVVEHRRRVAHDAQRPVGGGERRLPVAAEAVHRHPVAVLACRRHRQVLRRLRLPGGGVRRQPGELRGHPARRHGRGSRLRGHRHRRRGRKRGPATHPGRRLRCARGGRGCCRGPGCRQWQDRGKQHSGGADEQGRWHTPHSCS